MGRKRKKSVLQRKTAERVLLMETKQAKELSDVMKQAALETRQKIDSLGEGYRLDRLKDLEKIYEETRITANARLRSKKKLAESLNEGLEQSVPLTADAAGIPKSSSFFSFAPVLPIEALSITSTEYIDLINDVTTELKNRAMMATKQAIAQGEGIEELKKRIVGSGIRANVGRDGVFRRARWRAEMIGRNTVNDLVNRGRMIGYAQIDEEYPELEMKKRWSAAGDDRVSDLCEALSGQTRDMSENFEALGWSGQQPPAHVNCRSAVIPVPKSYKPSFEEQWEPKGNRKTSEQLAKEQLHPSILDFHKESISKNPLSDSQIAELAETAKFRKAYKNEKKKIERIRKTAPTITYQEADAFEKYIGADYGEMNKALWNAEVISRNAEKHERTLAKNRLAVSAMKKLPATTLDDIREVDPSSFRDFLDKGSYLRHDMTVSPAMRKSMVKKYRGLMDADDPVIMEKFFSTTFQPQGEGMFAEGSNIKILVKGKLDGSGNSVLVDRYKNFANEREVLFRPNTEFRILSVNDSDQVIGYSRKKEVVSEGFDTTISKVISLGEKGIDDEDLIYHASSAVMYNEHLSNTLKDEIIDTLSLANTEGNLLEGLKEVQKKYKGKIKATVEEFYDNPKGIDFSNPTNPLKKSLAKLDAKLEKAFDVHLKEMKEAPNLGDYMLEHGSLKKKKQKIAEAEFAKIKKKHKKEIGFDILPDSPTADHEEILGIIEKIDSKIIENQKVILDSLPDDPTISPVFSDQLVITIEEL